MGSDDATGVKVRGNSTTAVFGFLSLTAWALTEMDGLGFTRLLDSPVALTPFEATRLGFVSAGTVLASPSTGGRAKKDSGAAMRVGVS